MNSIYSSTTNLVEKGEVRNIPGPQDAPQIFASYDIERRIYEGREVEDPSMDKKVGMVLFFAGFFIPITWFVGAITCFTKGPKYSRNWGIANIVASILFTIGISCLIVFISIYDAKIPANITMENPLINNETLIFP